MKIYQKTAFLSLMVVSFIMLNACGFKIATNHSLGEKYSNLVIIGNKHDQLYIELENQLVINGVNIVDGDKSIAYYQSVYLPVLTCGSLRNSSTTVAVSSNSQDLEYTKRSEISCQLYTPNHKPYAINSSINRAVVSTPGSNLASDSKDTLLINENAIELAHEIIDRLHGSYLTLKEEIPVAEDENLNNPLTSEHIRVVFNATSGDEPSDETVVTNEEQVQAVIDNRTSLPNTRSNNTEEQKSEQEANQ